jgi:hypothetical protein
MLRFGGNALMRELRQLDPLHMARQDAEAARHEVRALRTSTCWRITAPLRRMVFFLRGIRGA